MIDQTEISDPTANKRPDLPGEDIATRTARMIRVDHAGELAAHRIYQGQLAVLEARGDRETATLIREMADHEIAHLDKFNDLVIARNVRPTSLRPLWDVAGFGLGVASALLGKNAAMACTAAVEEVIDAHYGAQEKALGTDDPELSGVISEFRADECAHRDIALANGAEAAPAYGPLSAAIKAGCRIAIKLSERF